MRRALALLLVSAAVATTPPLIPHARAAGRDRLVRCKGPGCTPAAFAFTPDGGTVFYAERLSGEIHRLTLDGHRDRRWAKIPDVPKRGEQGVLGIAVDPEWDQGPSQRWVYVYYTESSPHRNVIVRLRRRGGGSNPTLLGRRRRGIQRDRLLSLPAGDFHDGGVMHFGPDGKLYVVTGDTQRAGLAQRRRSPAGKVLRLEQNGKRPADNPIRRSKAFSFGHRNSFGFAFDPATGDIWQTENG
ncbi:MAG: PQQ-dependent sugar dehydrogenase, partial [Actinomycetota bacterium]